MARDVFPSSSVTLQIYSMAASAASARPLTPPAKWKACHLHPPATRPLPPFRICLRSEHELQRLEPAGKTSSFNLWSSWCLPLNHCFHRVSGNVWVRNLMPRLCERIRLKTLWAPAASWPSWMVLGCCVIDVWDTEHWTDCWVCTFSCFHAGKLRCMFADFCKKIFNLFYFSLLGL